MKQTWPLPMMKPQIQLHGTVGLTVAVSRNAKKDALLDSTWLDQAKKDVKCGCNKKGTVCSWKGSVSSCQQNTCNIRENFSAQGVEWRGDNVRCSKDGEDFGVFNEDTNYPEGTVCADVCKPYWGFENGNHWDESTCRCAVDRRGNFKCSFDNRQTDKCIPHVCSTNTEWMFNDFEQGFTHENADIDHFAPDLVYCT